VQIVLCDPSEPRKELHLFYRLADSSISRKFHSLLSDTLASGAGIIDPDRFHNFPGCHKNREWIVRELNRCIDLINRHQPGAILRRAKLYMTQDDLNHLHRYFEDYRGTILSPGEFYRSAPAAVQDALNQYNLLIHRYEDFERNARFPHAICCWEENKRTRLPLAARDFMEFRYGLTFGDLVLNYCELGKPILDAFFDDDRVMSDDNIRPLRYYSADLFLSFGTGGLSRKLPRWIRIHPKGFKEWWKSNYSRVKGAIPDLKDPSLALGHIVLGSLIRGEGSIRGFSEQEIVAEIGRHQFFKQVRCSPGGST
jgi:hypothetical protein